MLGSSKATELLSEIYPVENPHRTCAQHSQLPQISGENNSLKNIMIRIWSLNSTWKVRVKFTALTSWEAMKEEVENLEDEEVQRFQAWQHRSWASFVKWEEGWKVFFFLPAFFWGWLVTYQAQTFHQLGFCCIMFLDTFWEASAKPRSVKRVRTCSFCHTVS